MRVIRIFRAKKTLTLVTYCSTKMQNANFNRRGYRKLFAFPNYYCATVSFTPRGKYAHAIIKHRRILCTVRFYHICKKVFANFFTLKKKKNDSKRFDLSKHIVRLKYAYGFYNAHLSTSRLLYITLERCTWGTRHFLAKCDVQLKHLVYITTYTHTYVCAFVCMCECVCARVLV